MQLLKAVIIKRVISGDKKLERKKIKGRRSFLTLNLSHFTFANE